MEKRRYALHLAYDGGAFRGFQRQPGLPTVQECLERALAHLASPSRLDVAARTDAGVHALGQVVTFSARAALDPGQLRATVNALTPPALLCLDAAEVGRAVHARASACSRTYVYLVGWPAPPPLRDYAWSLPDGRSFAAIAAPRVDLGLAEAALRRIVGEHDFGGFARPGEQTARRDVDPRATVATVLSASVVPATDMPLLAFVIEGTRFVRAMVRHVVGTVVSVGIGAAEPAVVSAILGAPRTRYRGVRAPGRGLTLARVAYRQPLFAPETI